MSKDFLRYLDLSNIDVTSTIQTCLDRTGECILPRRKIFRLDGTIHVKHEQTLVLNESTLIREAHNSQSVQNNDPMIWISGNFAKALGSGWLLSRSVCNRGMIHVGPVKETIFTNINWVNVKDIKMEYQGSSSQYTVGIMLSSSEPQVGGSNYNGTYRDNYISKVARGIVIGKECNAQGFHENMFYKIEQYCYEFVDNSENTIMGGFTHLSPKVISIINMKGSYYNISYGVQGEPGGKLSKYFQIDDKSYNCQILGHDNCSSGPVDNGTNTTYLSHGHLRLNKITEKKNEGD